MYILAKQFSDKSKKRYAQSVKDNEIDNDEYNELLKLFKILGKFRK